MPWCRVVEAQLERSCSAAEARIFFLKMKGDYYGHAAEVCAGCRLSPLLTVVYVSPGSVFGHGIWTSCPFFMCTQNVYKYCEQLVLPKCIMSTYYSYGIFHFI